MISALWDVVKEDIANRAREDGLEEEQGPAAAGEWSPV
jgi:hypothetical protein